MPLYWYYTWDQKDIDEMLAPHQEYMGIDVYGDGKRNFYRAIAEDYIAECNESIAAYQSILTIAPVIQQNMRMTVLGHKDPNLSCDNESIANALMNVIVAPIEEELTELKNPDGETEYLTMHNQSIAAKKIWKKYAGRTLTPCLWSGNYGRIAYSNYNGDPPELAENEAVIVTINQTPYPPVGMDGVLTDGGSYRVGILSDYHFYLKNMDGTPVLMPSGSSCHLTVIRQKKTEILSFKIEAKLYSLSVALLSCQMIGLYDSTGEFFIVTKDPVFSSQAFELVSFKMALIAWSEADQVKQKLIEYPTPHQYQCVHWPMKDVVFGAEEKIKMSVSITGQNLDIPENFGLSVALKPVQREACDPVLWTYDIKSEKGSFGEMMYPDEPLKSVFDHIPKGFYWFASKYHDHPLITGQDINLITREEEDEMALALEINAYVNNNYTYRPENSDNWEFMGAGRRYGDCEDFALTKAQMMLDAGISVKNIQLDAGFPKEDNDEYEAIIVGHLWLLYKNNYVMDTSSNSFRTVKDMLAIYPRRHLQVSGLTWLCDGIMMTIPRDMLWPTHNVDIKMFDFDCYIKKLTR